jgi:hypothetical protein
MLLGVLHLRVVLKWLKRFCDSLSKVIISANWSFILMNLGDLPARSEFRVIVLLRISDLTGDFIYRSVGTLKSSMITYF